MADNTLAYTLIDTDTDFVIQRSPKGEDDWCEMDDRTFDTWIVALSAMQRWIADTRDEDEYDYRIVRKTVTSEVVTHA